jgi:hypothetical protein
MYATRFPSGDQRASLAATLDDGNARGVPPDDGMRNV